MKRKIALDTFQEFVLPTLQQKHTDLAALQKAINDDYTIVQVGEDGKETPIEFVVAKSGDAKETKAEKKADETPDIKALVTDAVKSALAEQARTVETKKVNLNLAAGEAAKEDKKPEKFTIPAEAKRYTPKHFAQKTIGGFDADERAYRFGMWLLAAKGNNTARQFCADHGVRLVEQKFSDPLLQKLHQENVNTTGGYLVPEEFSSDIIDLKETYGVVRRLFASKPMMSDTIVFPRRTGGLTAYPVAEGAAGTESTATWDQVRMTAKDWMVLTRMTNQVSADSVINFADTLAFEIAYAHTLKEDQAGLIGTATSTYAGIAGVNQALSNKWSTGTAGVGYGLVKQGTGTTFGAIVLGDFDNVVGSLPQYADTPNTCWVMHRAFYYSVVEKLVQASGGVPAYEVRQGVRAPRPIFKGYPVEFSQVMASVTASATVCALLGDFKLGASFGDRQQDQIAFSDVATVGGQSMFERSETAVRGVARWDINVHDVGDGTTVGPIVGLITG